MKTEFVLRVVLSDTLHANLTAYANKTGLSLSNVTRCFLATGLPSDRTPEELVELIALRDKLQKKIDARGKQPSTTGQGERGGGGEVS